MEETQFQSRVREHLGLRVGPEMAKYLLRKLADDTLGQDSISAMGGDAKTGIPVHKIISIDTLKSLTDDDRLTPNA